MNKIKYVNYDNRYLTSLLECWNSTLTHDVISKKRFQDLYLYDENFSNELLMLAINNDKVIGFIFGIKRKVSYYTKGLEPNRGWIINMSVINEYQNNGIGQMLYDRLIETFKKEGVNRVTLGAFSPNYIAPGVDVNYDKGVKFFVKNGYPNAVNAVSMFRTLHDFTLDSAMEDRIKVLQEQGIFIKEYSEKYFSKLFSFLEEEFEPGWKRNVIMALQKNEAENTVLICVDKNDDVIGYCMRKIDGNPERFGPIGVSEKLRSKGLGGVLFDYMMYSMKKDGLHLAYFLWTSGDAIRFYERHGMKEYRKYFVMSKEI